MSIPRKTFLLAVALNSRDRSFDHDWRFLRADAPGAENPAFDMPYAPGKLRALGLIGGGVVAKTTLKTSGEPKKLKLTADRTTIRPDYNDLSFVVVDTDGQRVPNAEIPVHLSVSGAGALAAQASGIPNDPASFRAPVRKTFQGRCLAILRPTGRAGDITLRAEADGLPAAKIAVGGQ